MNGGGFLQTSHALEPLHRPFSPSKRKMRIFASVVLPATGFLILGVPNCLHRSAVGAKFIGHHDMWLTVEIHQFPEKFQCTFLIPTLRDIELKHFTRTGAWVRSLLECKPTRVVTVAIANKTARTAWALLAKGESYKATSAV